MFEFVCMYNVRVFVCQLRTSFGQLIIIIIIIMAGMAVFNVAGYVIEERRRWPVNYRFPTRTMF